MPGDSDKGSDQILRSGTSQSYRFPHTPWNGSFEGVERSAGIMENNAKRRRLRSTKEAPTGYSGNK